MHCWGDANKFPIGHLAVSTDKGEGRMTVEARSVPAVDLINRLADQLGITVKYKVTPLAYVSADAHDVPITSADNILREVAAQGEFPIVNNEGTYIVGDCGDDDPSDGLLTDEELTAKYSAKIDVVEAQDGIASGLVFIDGCFVSPPYQFSSQETSDGKIELLLNGARIFSFETALPRPRQKLAPPTLPASGQFSDWSVLANYVCQVLYPALLPEHGRDRALDLTAEFVASQGLVDKVYSISDNGDIIEPDGSRYEILVLRQNGTAIALFPGDYDLDIGQFVKASYSNVDPKAAVEQKMQVFQRSIESTLERDQVIVFCDGFIADIRPPDFASIYQDSLGKTFHQRFNLWRELFANRDAAKYLSANLPKYESVLLKNLDTELAAR